LSLKISFLILSLLLFPSVQINQCLGLPMAKRQTTLWWVVQAAAKPLSDCTGLPSSLHYLPAVVSKCISTEKQCLSGQGQSLVGCIILCFFM
jgi:hypothetical protein